MGVRMQSVDVSHNWMNYSSVSTMGNQTSIEM